MILRPQPGPQEQFLSTPADICIFGGAAGGGKSFVLMMEPHRYSSIADFGSVIFRRLSTQITSQGGLWDTAMGMYPNAGAKPFLSPRYGFRFPSGAKLSFAHLQYETDVQAWQGSQIPLIGFDELTHFTEHQFFYMLSRNRSTCGVRPYIRATCNPDVDSWVASFISWWIDQETGYPIPERAGVVRYFTRLSGVIHWGNTREELMPLVKHMAGDDENPLELVKSLTFIPSKLEDNAILMKMDPGYKASLLALPTVERERLLGGNWKIRKKKGDTFPSDKVTLIDAIPEGITRWVRRWDLAASVPSEQNPDPDATASILMGLHDDGRVVIANGTHDHINADDVRKMIRRVSTNDKMQFRNQVKVILPQDPGQAGKAQLMSYAQYLKGFSIFGERETGGKETRADPFSAQWLAGNVYIVNGPWVKHFLDEMEGFPFGKHDDYPDAASGAYNKLIEKPSVQERFEKLAS